MEITSFVLGVLSVIFILGIIVGFLGASKIEKLEQKTNSLIREIEDCNRYASQISELDNRRIDGEIDRVNDLIKTVYKDVDSRFDKFENKLKNSKQLLKD